MTNTPPVETFKPEQRLTFRLLSYWNRIRADRTFPSLSDVNIHEIEEMWHFSFTLDVSVEGNHFFQYFGPELVSIFGTNFTGEHVSEAMNDVILNNTVGSYTKCIEKREPTMEAASFSYDGKEMRYRTLIVPFSNDGVYVNYLMGTTNYKAF